MAANDTILRFVDQKGGISTIPCHPSNAGMLTLHYQAKGWKLVEDVVPEPAPEPVEPEPKKRGRKPAEL